MIDCSLLRILSVRSMSNADAWDVARPPEKGAVIVFFHYLERGFDRKRRRGRRRNRREKAEEDCAVYSNGGDAPSSGKWAM